ncbi:Hypothetical protein NCS54_00492800 [Fusarium falciforme]|uniref:Hypothetical protein n=1 Tax=Fusarium falciforme TaxID=195108 RepID=UPI002300ED43|nr:Hypothetical protein NCS54_00492800 [Fusarium falciforme]WAO87612.1 Hypothetical protein NCS54_00492800 [Fusarium falciforme]
MLNPRDSAKDNDFELYRYTPSLPAAIHSVIVFAILTVVHTVRLRQARANYFIPFTIGGLFQTIGYAGRIWGHYDEEALGGFVTQAVLILVAPALYAASIYMILGRLIRTLDAQHLFFIPLKWVTKIFVAGDVLSFTLQASGGGLSSGGTVDMYHLGEKVIVAGLFVQIAIFGIFVVSTAIFHSRIRKNPTAIASHGDIPWKRHLNVLYLTSGLILVRSIFRVIEYIQGNDGYLISHEVFLYVFDALLMAAVMVIFLVSYVDGLTSAGKDKEASVDSNGHILDELR